MSKYMGVHRVALNSTLNNPNIKLSTLEKIAAAIGCEVGDFFRDEGDGSATVVCPHCGKPVTVELK